MSDLFCFEVKDNLTKHLFVNPVHKRRDLSEQQFAIVNIVNYVSLVFRVIFDQSVPENKCYCGIETKMLIFEQEDPSALALQMREYNEKDTLDSVDIFVASSESSICESIRTDQIKEQLLQTRDWYNQNEAFSIVYKHRNTNFNLLLTTRMTGEKTGGFLSETTQITFKKELHQKFRLVDDEKNSCETDSKENENESDDFLYQIKKRIGGHDKHLEIIQNFLFNSRMLTADWIKKLNIQHIKGVLLYGPPGTGKTAIARAMEKFSSLPMTIIDGPSIMDKFVGESERKIRAPFEAAMQDYIDKGENSPVHIIVIDEIDAICKKRGTSSTNVYDSIVNQLLTCIDGVKKLNNILIIAMTNRKDMLDTAILRSGRIEVHIEICLPNQEGRIDILNIHTRELRENGVIHQSVDLNKINKYLQNYTGAEIQALVRNAHNLALADWKKIGLKEENIGKTHFICQEHFDKAYKDFKPQFGADTALIESKIPKQKIKSQQIFPEAMEEIEIIMDKIKNSENGKYTILVTGGKKAGKTVFACELAQKINFEFMKLMDVDKMIGLVENGKLDKIYDVYFDSLKCNRSVIIFDEIIDLIEYVALDKHYSKTILQAFLQILKKSPEEGKKTVIIVTESRKKILKELGLYDIFNFRVELPEVSGDKIEELLEERGYDEEEREKVREKFSGLSVGELNEMFETTYKNRNFLEKYLRVLKGRKENMAE